MGMVTIRWVESHLMLGTDSNGHSVVIGKNPEDETSWAGVRPSDLLLMGAASCSAWDVVSILAKQREPLKDLKVICSGEQASDPPYTFTRIHLHYIITGPVNPEKLQKAINLCEDRYCSVICTLRPGVPVTSDYEIREN